MAINLNDFTAPITYHIFEVSAIKLVNQDEEYPDLDEQFLEFVSSERTARKLEIALKGDGYQFVQIDKIPVYL